MRAGCPSSPFSSLCADAPLWRAQLEKQFIGLSDWLIADKATADVGRRLIVHERAVCQQWHSCLRLDVIWRRLCQHHARTVGVTRYVEQGARSLGIGLAHYCHLIHRADEVIQ